MDYFLSLSSNTDTYSNKIEKNKYTQGENENVINKTILKSKNILEIILSLFDYNYQILENSEKESYVIKKSLELSTFLDLNYDNYNYNPKKFNKNLVSNSLQNKNNLSSILFYNDYYNINIVICNNDRFYKSSKYTKHSNMVYINYDNNLFNVKDDVSEIPSYLDICDKSDTRYTLESVLHFDITDTTIYKSSLKPIATYKADEIINLAKEKNIDILNEKGKKKTKKELYEKLILLG